jgi:transcriptional regulator with XRE-family HTH domain
MATATPANRTTSHPTGRTPPIGELLRDWRERRRLSQLALSTTSAVSTRHLSYVENGRARPSRELVEHLAERLDVPLRERNRLLIAAGYAPRFTEVDFAAAEMAAIRRATEQILAAHDPFPAVVVDGRWNLVSANAATSMFLQDVDPALLTPTTNVVRLSLHPDGMAPRIVNFDEYATHMVERLRRQVETTADPGLTALLDEVSPYVPSSDGHHDASAAAVVLPLVFASPVGELRLFSTIATFGAPLDVTVSELAIESFYPTDDETAARLRQASTR